MAKNLDEVKADLYDNFNRAMTYGRKVPSDNYSTDNPQRLQAAAASMQAAAMTADAIAKVERELTIRDMIKELREQGADIEVDIEKGIVRSISPMSKIKLKPPGDA